MSFQIGNYKSSIGIDAKKAAIEAAKAKALGTGASEAAMVKYIPPAQCPDRTRIVFDDSGSMCSQISNAKNGVVEYLKNCIPNQSAVAVHFMNTTSWSTALTSNLPQLGQDILEAELQSGGTPFFNTLKKALEATPKLTRLVAFTDGSPTDRLQAEKSEELEWNNLFGSDSQSQWIQNADIIIKISKAIGGEKCIPIDTIFFGSAEYSAKEIQLLKYLSEKTGGFFLHFDPSKPNIWKQLKYLAPVNRLALTDGSFRAKVERGES